jgi:hypothetical protein
METTSRAEEQGAPDAPEPSAAHDAAAQDGAVRGATLRDTYAQELCDAFSEAGLPWYGLDAAFTGPRRLMQIGAAADGAVQHGSVGHGSEPSTRPEALEDPGQRFAVVITVAASPARRSGDGTGQLEATTASSAAWLAGSGLLACTWPAKLDHALRDDWLSQQTETAFELADDLDSPEWSALSLPVDGEPTRFRYRESEYGWVLAGSTGGVHLGAYGRGMSAYGLGFSRIEDMAAYEA